MITGIIERLQVFAFTHKTLPLELVGKFHLPAEKTADALPAIKLKLGLEELMYLSTCNRVEFIFVRQKVNEPIDVSQIINALQLELSTHDSRLASRSVESFHATDAVRHLFNVSASLDSMVIGEREIITQVRKAFEDCNALGLTGDLLRLVVQKTIQNAKQVFTETAIFKKPVSVVSLAFYQLKDMNMPAQSRIVMVGAGKTNKAMARFLSKHGYKNIVIYNRSLIKAENLAKEIGGRAGILSEIDQHTDGFDVLISCTSSGQAVIDKSLYTKLLAGESGKKILIDLAIPADISAEVIHAHADNIRYINIEELKKIADKNLAERSLEIVKCDEIVDHNMIEFYDRYRHREVELAMGDIPRKVREIKTRVIDTVYAKEIGALDTESREVLDKVLAYMEKKYISVPMKMAKEVMLNRGK